MTIRQQQAMSIFVREGYAPSGAAAIVGGLSGESGINLDSTVNRVNADHGSGGIAEWRLDRKPNMVSFVQSLGLPADDLKGQCLFVIHELEYDYPALNAELRAGVKPVVTMCWNFVKVFERPNMAVAHMNDIRVPQAIKVCNDYVAANHAMVPPIAVTGAVVGTASGGGAVATVGQVPPWASITMGLVSAASYLVTAFNVKSKPIPLPTPEPQQEVAVPMTAVEEFRRDDALAKAALVQRQKSLDKVKAQAAELNEIMSHEDVKIIDNTPVAIGAA